MVPQDATFKDVIAQSIIVKHLQSENLDSLLQYAFDRIQRDVKDLEKRIESLEKMNLEKKLK